VKSLLRAAAALTVVSLLLAFLGTPVCYSSACPMSGTERAACKAMGRECCGTKGGQVSQAPVAPALVLAALPAALALAASTAETAAFANRSEEIAAAPAILQGVGLFTLFDVFLI
jgi:hypothetical protein